MFRRSTSRASSRGSGKASSKDSSPLQSLKDSPLQSKDSNDSPLLAPKDALFFIKDSVDLASPTQQQSLQESPLVTVDSEDTQAAGSSQLPLTAKDSWQSYQSTSDLSLDQPVSDVYLPVPKLEHKLSGQSDVNSNEPVVQSQISVETPDPIREAFGITSVEDEKRDPVQEWMSHNYLGPMTSNSLSADEPLIDFDSSHQAEPAAGHRSVSANNSLLSSEMLSPVMQKGRVRKISTTRNVIVCECAKYWRRKDLVVAMGIDPADMCKDQLGLETSQFLDVEYSSATGPYSPQSSTEDNYTGFGINKGSRKELLEELGSFSNLQPHLPREQKPFSPGDKILQELAKLSQSQPPFRAPKKFNSPRPGRDEVVDQLVNLSNLYSNQQPIRRPEVHAHVHVDRGEVFEDPPKADPGHAAVPQAPAQEQAVKTRNDSGFASTTTTIVTSPPSPPVGLPAGAAAATGAGHHSRFPQFHFSEIQENVEPPPADFLPKRKRGPLPPDLNIALPVGPGQGPEVVDNCSAEVANLTSGLELPLSPLAQLSPIAPERPFVPSYDSDWNRELSEHFTTDYFSFTGLVDVKTPPHQVRF